MEVEIPGLSSCCSELACDMSLHPVLCCKLELLTAAHVASMAGKLSALELASGEDTLVVPVGCIPHQSITSISGFRYR